MAHAAVSRALGCVARWLARIVLVLFVAFTLEIWLDVLVFAPEEYERLIGSQAACGKATSYCSWPAFVLDSIPLFVLSILAVVVLLWRNLAKRELMIGLLAAAICAYLAWRVYLGQHSPEDASAGMQSAVLVVHAPDHKAPRLLATHMAQ